MNKKTINIVYWASTGLLCAGMLMSGILSFIHTPDSEKGMAMLQLPMYLSPFLGTAKILGVIALLVPGFPKIREWAYAGFCFDALGAAWCIYSSNGFCKELPFPIIFLVIIFTSYFMNQKRNVLN